MSFRNGNGTSRRPRTGLPVPGLPQPAQEVAAETARAEVTLNAICDLIDRAVRMARNPSPVLQCEAAALLARVERHLPTALLEPEVTCGRCTRESRTWFATAVADGQLWPLCSRACVAGWRAHQY